MVSSSWISWLAGEIVASGDMDHRTTFPTCGSYMWSTGNRQLCGGNRWSLLEFTNSHGDHVPLGYLSKAMENHHVHWMNIFCDKSSLSYFGIIRIHSVSMSQEAIITIIQPIQWPTLHKADPDGPAEIGRDLFKGRRKAPALDIAWCLIIMFPI